MTILNKYKSKESLTALLHKMVMGLQLEFNTLVVF